MLCWVTLTETIAGKTYTHCLMRYGKGMKELLGSDKTDILNVPADCVFTNPDRAKAMLDSYAEMLDDNGLLSAFRIQMHILQH